MHRLPTRNAFWLPLMAVLLLVLLPHRAASQASGYFTLTDGRHLWYEAAEWNDATWRSSAFLPAYDTVHLTGGSWSELHTLSTSYNLVVEHGAHYLALSIDEENPEKAVVASRDFSLGLNEYCMWMRTGYTGFYYQEHDGYRYYLKGTPKGLSVYVVAVGAPLEDATQFYNWDFGAAITDVTYRNGVRNEAYHWAIYADGAWSMSGDTYQRPDARKFGDASLSPAKANPGLESNLNFEYCDHAAGDVQKLSGQPALHLPVAVTSFARTVKSLPEGKGIASLEVTYDDGASTLGYKNAATVAATVVDGGTVEVLPAYTKYEEETLRYGINPNYRLRSAAGYGDSGVWETKLYYSYGEKSFVDEAEAPKAESSQFKFNGLRYELDNKSHRYVKMTLEGEGSDRRAVLRCKDVPPKGVKVKVRVYADFAEGVTLRDSVEIALSDEYGRREMPDPAGAPVVAGAVFGGGRMANVAGGTAVTVHYADSIGAVYGGNDIAGWVQGEAGAVVQLGTTLTDATHEVRIGRVYGGGCGLYVYPGVVIDAEDYPYDPDDYTYGLADANYWFKGSVYRWGTRPGWKEGTTPSGVWADDLASLDWSAGHTVTATDFDYTPAVARADENGDGGNGTVPYVKRSRIAVGLGPADESDSYDYAQHNDYVLVDTLFGGAENAFIGVADGSAATVDVYGGTVYALFGGNNYGGSLADGSRVQVNVHDTKLAPADRKDIQNSFFREYGREYGIRYLFGGGNLVNSSLAEVNVTGGMIDSCYLGGNMATVQNPMGTVNCRGSHYIFDNDSVTHDMVGGVLGSQKDLSDEANYAALKNYRPGRLSRAIGRYNIRTLFGGNNRAPMSTLSTINLVSGGISNVYGGGNAGDMNNEEALAANSTLADLVLNQCLDGWEYEKPAALGTLVHSTADSRVMVEQIYAGCRMANVRRSSMLWLEGGVFGYVYGGNDISGDVGSASGEGTYAVLDGALVLQSIYGGSNGYYHCHNEATGTYIDDGVGDTLRDNVSRAYQDLYGEYVGLLVPTQNNSNLYVKDGNVLHSAYGGGVMTDIGFLQGSPKQIYLRDQEKYETIGVGDQVGSIHFTMRGGTVGTDVATTAHNNGNAYGGGYLSNLYGLSYSHVTGTTKVKGSLFAANDCLGIIDAFGAYSRPGVDAASYTASDNTPLNELLQDGSRNRAFTAYMLIDGTPTINSVYGGGNGAYNYHNPERPEYSDVEPVCMVDGRDNRPRQGSAFIDINTSGGFIDTVFGGGNGVGVQDAVRVLLNNTDIVNAERADSLFVGTIFGGNNRDNMAQCVPNIVLTRGTARDVYGGGNAGSMGGSAEFFDVCGDPVDNVSTHVRITSDDVVVTRNVYGGCRMADVEHMAFVEILSSKVRSVYGGNDISGRVYGNTRVDVSGGTVDHIYGGGNGYYSYPVVDGQTQVRSLADGSLVAESSTGAPFVDSTTVRLLGGTLTTDVFAGGRMGDCRSTYLYVNDQLCPANSESKLIINGDLFGGGEGDTEHLLCEHRGNVLADASSDSKYTATHVHLHHAEELSKAQAYGGGKGGDVVNTYITAYETWDTPFRAIYGGCWGSNVFGTAHVNMYGDTTLGGRTAETVFGGNDFTGNVYMSEVNIYSGRYGAIYGAGNGYGNTSGMYTAAMRQQKDCSDVTRTLYTPNNEYVEVNVNGPCIVDSNLYGGGKLGTTFAYRRDSQGVLVDSEGERHTNEPWLAEPDTTLTLAALTAGNARLTNPELYSHIIVNVHDGLFNQNIYAGAAGDQEQLVYGLKVLNIDGGEVVRSIYGGSERVDDGYRSECQAIDQEKVSGLKESADHAESLAYIDTKTTRRPSSIVNVAGGLIRGSVYGGGYMGKIYGSTYVNVGEKAIDSSEVWKSQYLSGIDSLYRNFKPGVKDGHTAVLANNDLQIKASVYGGANWGSNTGSRTFNVAGFFGGETLIRVDGEGYLTASEEGSLLNPMHITHSIIGSGTSALGGDVRCRVDVRNYGGIDNCHATPDLRSIQRADTLMLYNTAIRYTGAIDAISSYLTQQYTINRIDVVEARGFNIVEIDALMTNIGKLEYYEEKLLTQLATPSSRHMTLSTIGDLATSNMLSSCDEVTDLCQKLAVLDGNKHTAMVVNNGVNIDVLKDGKYGTVEGYAYFMAAPQTNAIIASKAKNSDDAAKGLYGGFLSSCQEENEGYSFTSDYEVEWSESSSASAEFPYGNYFDRYRIWSIGSGMRSRYATIWAHAEPSKLDSINKHVHLRDDNGTEYNYAVAISELDLPSSTPGHYYTISSSGILIRDDNSAMRLADEAWNPVDTNKMKYKTLTSGQTWQDIPVEDYGNWEKGGDANGTISSAIDIGARPGATFGLVMASGENFQGHETHTYVDPAGNAVWAENGATLISGNPNVSIQQSYRSGVVGGEMANSNPQMTLYLTYDTNFSNTLIGNVSFQLEEHDETGDIIGTVDVVITINTIVEDFIDQEYEVLAMYNEGRSNVFRRKAVLPATMDPNRSLYLKRIVWMPTDENGVDYRQDTHPTDGYPLFYLTDKESVVVGEEKPNTFALSILPTDNVTSTITTYRGWADGGTKVEEPIDFYSQSPVEGQARWYDMEIGTSGDGTGYAAGHTKELAGRGVFVGELDGRGEAAMSVDLTFDGEKIYPPREGKGYVGKAILGFDYYNALGTRLGDFNMTVYVKVREHGDTIYLASSETVERPLVDSEGTPVECGGEAQSVKLYGISKEDIGSGKNHWFDDDGNTLSVDDLWNDPKGTKLGKEPNKYVRTFRDALDANIYTEGDVIAIIDQVDIAPGDQVTIQGAAYTQIPVIRYFGHHHQLPGEGCVYRGTMIALQGGHKETTVVDGKTRIYDYSRTSFTARAIAFDGSSMGKVKSITGVKNCSETNFNITKKYAIETDYHPDTNVAYGPVIAVVGDEDQQFTTISLEDDVILENNWSDASDDALRGAINVGSHGELSLMNSVTIRHNLTSTARDADAVARPHDGAVFVKDGSVALAESHEASAIIVSDNFINPGISDFWEKKYIDGKFVRYAFNRPADMTDRANVFLTRTEKTAGDNMLDDMTDVIRVANEVSSDTRIGVSKWFPGIDERDTIRIVYQSGGDLSVIGEAYHHGNFFSDNPAIDTLFHEGISRNNIYLHRCATFRQQSMGDYDLLVYNTKSHEYSSRTVQGQDVLQYLDNKAVSCPSGSDQIVYSVRGGFFPYTYTWSGSSDEVNKYTLNNSLMMSQVEAGNMANYNRAVSDTLSTDPIVMGLSERTKVIEYTVTAADVAGCLLTKKLHVVMHKEKAEDVLEGMEFVKSNDAVWTELVPVNSNPADVAVAEGDRYYRGVQITPMVWADRNYGSVSMRVGTQVYTEDGTPRDPVFVEDAVNGRHDVADMLFCEGERIRLSTTPTFPLSDNSVPAEFIMWDFDPFYNNPADYIVPAHSDTVVAYYGPGGSNKYWVDTISTPEKGRIEMVDEFVYEKRKDPKSGYVVTYQGDVHIYNEEGLAWFISEVNGLNNVAAHTYYFQKVYLHRKAGNAPYDMHAHLWTPVGSAQHPFRGWFIGVENGDSVTVPAVQPVVIKNVIINEPTAYYAGFFGNIDTARIRSVKLESAMVRGGQYVGALAANSTHARIDNCGVDGDLNDMSAERHSTSILSTTYVSGGLLGKSSSDQVRNSYVRTKFIGDAVYSGGLVGDGQSTSMMDNVAWNANRERMSSAVYEGGLAGRLEGGSDTSQVEEPEYYSIEVRANDARFGIVSGGGYYAAGDTVTLTATPLEGCYFEGWVDADTSRVLRVVVTSDKLYQANFHGSAELEDERFQVNVIADQQHGMVEVTNGSDEGFSYGQTAIVSATAYDKTWLFDHWSDGSYDNPHYVVVTDNMELTAYFVRVENPTYTLTLLASPADWGEVAGGGTYPADTTVQISAAAFAGYTFDHWSDSPNFTNSTRMVVVDADKTITAIFKSNSSDGEQYYTVNATVSESNFPNSPGNVFLMTEDGMQLSNGGQVLEGTAVIFTAEAVEGYVFDHWSNQSQSNPCTVTVTGDIDLIAYFVTIPNPNGKPLTSTGKAPLSYVLNNYVRYSADGSQQRVGGLVGYASNTVIENNYVYGSLHGSATEGAVGAVLDKGVKASHNYFASGTVAQAVGQQRPGSSVTATSRFDGQGNGVELEQTSYGVKNLTRALNIWVRDHSGHHRSWRSDMLGANGGYPVFGVPDLIPVFDTMLVSGCDSVEWGGVVYTADAVTEHHFIDSVAMVDSTTRLRVVIHHSTSEHFADSIGNGEEYSGYGFYVTPTEYAMLQQTISEQGRATLTLSNTMVGVNGCDSVVTLALTVRRTEGIEQPAEVHLAELRVYPNPATSRVTVEVEGLRHVELYDSEGRRLQDYTARDEGSLTIDVSHYATGAYYLRVHTPDNVIIQKLIKQ